MPLKERIEHASFRLRAQLDKLDHMYSRLQQRDRDLFQRCVGAQVSKDFAHSKLYANECAEIRKIARTVLGSQLALEKVILRLETVEEFGNIVSQMAPVMSIVKETKSKIAGVVPQVASELDAVNNLLGEFADEQGEVNVTNIPIETTDAEAKKVLEETGVIAEQRLRDQFPDLPVLDAQGAKHTAILETATSGSALDERLQEEVFQYARKHDGELNIHSCADSLGTSPHEVKNALERLRDAGRIIFE